MRTLGVLGGMSWESTLVYYRLLNQGIAKALGGLHSAPLRIASADFAPIAAQQRGGDWDGAAAALGKMARQLRDAGAEGLLLATNTMHKVAKPVQEEAGLPLLHIGDATGSALKAAGCRRAGLLGTRFTMEDDFLSGHLAERFDVQAIVPDRAGRDEVHRTIYEELCRGMISDESRERYRRIMADFAERGCDAVILGCTEITLLTPPDQPPPDGWPLPLFDTTALHAHEAVQWMLADHEKAP